MGPSLLSHGWLHLIASCWPRFLSHPPLWPLPSSGPRQYGAAEDPQLCGGRAEALPTLRAASAATGSCPKLSSDLLLSWRTPPTPSRVLQSSIFSKNGAAGHRRCEWWKNQEEKGMQSWLEAKMGTGLQACRSQTPRCLKFWLCPSSKWGGSGGGKGREIFASVETSLEFSDKQKGYIPSPVLSPHLPPIPSPHLPKPSSFQQGTPVCTPPHPHLR